MTLCYALLFRKPLVELLLSHGNLLELAQLAQAKLEMFRGQLTSVFDVELLEEIHNAAVVFVHDL